MKRKAVFGGTFDPIHNGHLHIAYEALYKLNLDNIIFVPTGNPPHKKKIGITDAFIRYEMVKMAVRCDKRFEVSSYEIEKKDLSYTYKTLKYFNIKEPETQWFFLTGGDCLIDLPTWKNVDSILKHCTFVVFSRPGYDNANILTHKKIIEEKYNTNIVLLDVPMLDISSTIIRNCFREKRNAEFLMPSSVYHTAKELKLYE